MKIGILIDQLTPGGVQKIAIEEVKNLGQLGYDTELIVIMRTENLAYKDILKDVKVRYLSDTFPRILQKSIKFPLFDSLSIHHIMAPILIKNSSLNYDIIVSHGSTTCFTAKAIWNNKKIPYISFVHDPMIYILDKGYQKRIIGYIKEILIPIVTYLEKMYLGSSLFVLTQSSVHKKSLEKLTNKKVFTLYPGTYSSKKIHSKKEMFILFATRWSVGKNLELVKSIARQFNNIRIVMAGSWVPSDLRDQFATSLNEENICNVDVLGRVTEKQLNNLYLNARVLVHPILEAFGMPVLEAASNGCPFVIPNGSGVTDLFTHGRDGYFPNENDVNAYTSYIGTLVLSENLSYEMGKNAWIVARKNTWKNHCQNLVRLIKTVKYTKS